MNIGLIGSGKTGGEVLKLYPREKITVFNTSNALEADKLRNLDVAIAFVPGKVILELAPKIIESKTPLVSGATGFTWPDEIHNNVVKNNLTWISGTNFSLGMRVIHQMIKKLNLAKRIFDDAKYSIHEIHHTKKLDAPSGTAKSWSKWLDQDVAEITHERVGDVVGDHTVELETQFEVIRLQHQALDRKIFAKGALWAADYIVKNKKHLDPGIHLFEEITEKILNMEEI